MREPAVTCIALLLAACGDPDPVTDPDLHRLGPCSAEWAPFDVPNQCEVACEVPPPGYTRNIEGEDVCLALFAQGQAGTSCTDRSVFEYDGVRGCCRVDGSANDTTAYFAVCVEDI